MTSSTVYTATDPIERVVPAVVTDITGACNIGKPVQVPHALTRPHDGLSTPTLYTADDLVLFHPERMDALRRDGGVAAMYVLLYHVVAVHSLRYHRSKDADAAAWAMAGFGMRRADPAELAHGLWALDLPPFALRHFLHGVLCPNLAKAFRHTDTEEPTP